MIEKNIEIEKFVKDILEKKKLKITLYLERL